MNIIDIAEAHCLALGEKNNIGMGRFLHRDVHCIGPLGELRGKEAVYRATLNVSGFITGIKIREKMASGEKALVTYDLDYSKPIGSIRTAALMTIQEDLITKIELFYDAQGISMDTRNAIYA